MQSNKTIPRRQVLQQSASLLGSLCLTPALLQTAKGNELERKRLLFFTKSSGFQHSVVTRDGTELAYAERIVTELGKKNNIDVHCSKDGGRGLRMTFVSRDMGTQPRERPSVLYVDGASRRCMAQSHF